MNRSLKIKSGCAVCFVLFGIIMCLGVASRILTEITRFDIAVILSVMSSLMILSFLIIPGFVYIIRQRIGTAIAAACVLIGTSMMWTLTAFVAVVANGGMPFFETEFYNALLPLLGLGFFGGVLTTGFAAAYYDMNKPKRTRKDSDQAPSKPEN